MNLEQLIERGFDRSRQGDEDNYLRVRCSQCEALVIQGVPCHESGCPNARRANAGREDDDE